MNSTVKFKIQQLIPSLLETYHMATELAIFGVNSHHRCSCKYQFRFPWKKHEFHNHSPSCCYLIWSCLQEVNQSKINSKQETITQIDISRHKITQFNNHYTKKEGKLRYLKNYYASGIAITEMRTKPV